MPGYFATRFVIGDRTIAEFLQNRNNWEIVNALIDDGIEGMTSEELAKRLNINYKAVTETTRHLAQMGWINSKRQKPAERRVGRPAAGAPRPDFRKPPYLHVWSNINSFEPVLLEEFEDHCLDIFDKHVGDFRQFLTAMDGIIAEMKTSARFYPKQPIHDCGWSHDGHEFVKGVLQAFLYWLESNAEFRTLLKKHKLATDEAFKD